MTQHAISKQLIAAAIALTAFGGITACSNDEATPAPDVSEETMNPDITPEQQEFVDELLTTPLPQDEATAMIESAGYVWRLGTIDGEPQAVTMDYRTDRLTLNVDQGLIIDATWG